MYITRAEKDDLFQIEALEKECFSEPWTYASLLESLEDPLYDFFVAKEDGRVLGYASQFTAVDEANVANVAVTAAARKRGLGKALTEALIGAAEARKAARIFLEVRESNFPAIHLYENAGFLRVGYRKNFYSFPVEAAVLYSLDLENME